MKFTGERMIPEFNRGQDIYLEHMTRYVFASQFVKNKTILDIACGSGYGSDYLLKAGAKKVIGVDISEETIDFCKQKYSDNVIEFLIGDVQKIPTENNSIDVIVSFETIEHVDEVAQVNFIKEVKRVLKPGGILIISTPNSLVYPKGNPFHVKELDIKEFERTLEKTFKNVDLFYQDDVESSYIYSKDNLNDLGEKHEVNKRLDKILPEASLYLIAVCSDNIIININEYVGLSNIKPYIVLWKEINERDAIIKQRDQVIKTKDQDIENINKIIEQKDNDLENKNKIIQLKEDEIASKRQDILSKDSLLELKKQELEVRNNEVIKINKEINLKVQEISNMRASKFWKLREVYIKLKKISFKKFVYFTKKVFFVLRRDGLVSLLGRIRGFMVRNIYGSIISIKEIVDSRNSLKKPTEINGLITVIIPIYDRTWELKQSIESILNQTYQNFELILVTDGSPKETIFVVEEYRNNPKVKIFHYYDNTGNAVRGRNKGIRESIGEYIAFQDSDDIAESERLEKSIKFLKLYNVDVVYGGWRAKLDGTRKDTDLVDGQEIISPDCDISMLRNVCVPCQSTVMVSKKALSDVGGLKTIMKYREDHELWLRLSYFGYKFKAIPEILTNLRLHKGNNELKFKTEDERWKKLMLSQYKIKKPLSKKIAYLIPGTSISGGIAVVLNHANLLLRRGYDIFLISQDDKTSIDWFPNQKVPIIALKDIADIKTGYYFDNIDILIATHWTTFDNVININSKRKIYFIQSDERNFDEDLMYKKAVQKTYEYNEKKVEYLTMANWIKKWLKKEFKIDASYVPNGLDGDIFKPVTPIKPKGKKLRVLLEGPIDIPFKGMREAFKVINNLDCEVWAISSSGKPQSTWRCDRFFEKVNQKDMAEIYSSCDILLKMSTVESFAYPPLEMMACGGVSVIKEVSGIEEYAQDSVNCLIIKDIKEAKTAIKKLISDKKLLNKLRKSGLETAAKFSWEKSIDILENIISIKNS
jgi:O-antigen biosynthesis protein